MHTTSMLVDPLTKDLPICVFQEYVTRMGLLRAKTLCFSGLSFHVFCKESLCFFVITCIFYFFHYLMIFCPFDQMNDIMIFFFLLNQYFCHCNAS